MTEYLTKLVPVGGYRLILLSAFAFTSVVALALIWLGEPLHEWLDKGQGSSEPYQSLRTYWILFANFIIPVATISAAFVTAKGWKSGETAQLYGWQALGGAIGFLLVCACVMGVLGHAFTVADWSLPINPRGELLGEQSPAGMQPAGRLEGFFSFMGTPILTASLAFGLLGVQDKAPDTTGPA